MISTRYAGVVLALSLVALVPTVIHSYVGATVNDGRMVSAIPERLDGFESTPTKRNPGWGKHHFESDEWVERTYQRGSDSVTLTVLRSYDYKVLYHHPELDIAYGMAFGGHEVQEFATDRSLPVHVLRPQVANGPLGMYVLHCDDEFIADPVRFQIRTGLELLVRPLKPMTLLFAYQQAEPNNSELSRAPVAQVLVAAVREFANPHPLTRQ